MNAGALKHFNSVRPSVYDLINKLGRQVSASDSAQDQDSPSTLIRLYTFAYIAYKAPTYWLIKYGDDRNNGLSVPATYSTISKISEGLLSLIRDIAMREPQKLYSLWTGEELFHYADQNKLLVGRKEVCAAPEKIIAQFLDAVLNSTQQIKTKELNLSSASTSLEATIYEYGLLCHSVEALSFVFEVLRCWVWHRVAEKFAHSEKFASEFDKNQPHSRSAIAHGQTAKAISKFPHVLKDPFFHTTSVFAGHLSQGNGLRRFHVQQLELARSITDTPIENAEDFSMVWSEFEGVTISAISEINSALGKLLSLKNNVTTLHRDEIEIFFGKVPVFPIRDAGLAT